MKSRIYYTKPSITEKEVAYAADAARYGWGDRCYEYIVRFEKQFSEFIGAKYSIATSSCTGALHMGLAALGIGPGDEVILADTNWIASAAPITYLGAKPVFVDILPDTWCINPDLVEAAINSKTRAIIAVHLYGNLCEMGRLAAIGKQYNIPVIEDCAEAIGSRWFGKHVGTLSSFGVFSFHGTKTLSTGEGGIFVTNDTEIYQKVLTLSNHGRADKQTKQFWPNMIGFKYKMSNIQAAIGCAQLERIDELIRRKREIFHYYQAHFNNLEGINMNPERQNTVSGYWMPTAVFSPDTMITRECLLEAFATENIDGRVFFYPLSSLPMFKSQTENIHSYDIPKRAINFPSYHNMTTSEQDIVVELVKNLYKKNGKLL